MPSLDSSITEKIRELCANGYQSYDLADYKAALRLFYQAWLLVPKPQTNFEEAGWILTAIGDAYFRLCQYAEGGEALLSAQHCPSTADNPFVNLRLGQCLLEQGKLGAARKELRKAYSTGGQAVFLKEGSKYLMAIEDVITE